MILHNYTSKEANDFILVLCEVSHRNRKLTTKKRCGPIFPSSFGRQQVLLDDKMVNVTCTEFQSQIKIFL